MSNSARITFSNHGPRGRGAQERRNNREDKSDDKDYQTSKSQRFDRDRREILVNRNYGNDQRESSSYRHNREDRDSRSGQDNRSSGEDRSNRSGHGSRFDRVEESEQMHRNERRCDQSAHRYQPNLNNRNCNSDRERRGGEKQQSGQGIFWRGNRGQGVHRGERHGQLGRVFRRGYRGGQFAVYSPAHDQDPEETEPSTSAQCFQRVYRQVLPPASNYVPPGVMERPADRFPLDQTDSVYVDKTDEARGCRKLLFSHFSSEELVSRRSVCELWMNEINEIFKSSTTKLMLFDCRDSVRRYENMLVQSNNTDNQELVTNTYQPNNSLTLLISSPPQLISSNFLDNFSALTTFAFVGNSESKQWAQSMTSVVKKVLTLVPQVTVVVSNFEGSLDADMEFIHNCKKAFVFDLKNAFLPKAFLKTTAENFEHIQPTNNEEADSTDRAADSIDWAADSTDWTAVPNSENAVAPSGANNRNNVIYYFHEREECQFAL